MWELVELFTFGLVPAFLVLDLVVRARPFQRPQGWRLYATLVTVMTLAVTVGVALFWGRIFESASLLRGHAWGIVGGAVVGVIVYEFLHYWYHRLAHSVHWLWRAGHQMHHAPESLDTFGALYSHPVDTAIFSTLSSLVFFPLLGLRVEAGLCAGLFLTFNAMFQHANLSTPQWLGYVIQRPESHAVHHRRGVHAFNYCDLPLWDMVFGTFKNPKNFEGEMGFEPGDSRRIFALLSMQDVGGRRRSTAVEDFAQDGAPDTERTRPAWVGLE